MATDLSAQMVEYAERTVDDILEVITHVNTVVSIDLAGMLRADCCGETRLALHVPSSS